MCSKPVNRTAKRTFGAQAGFGNAALHESYSYVKLLGNN